MIMDMSDYHLLYDMKCLVAEIPDEYIPKLLNSPSQLAINLNLPHFNFEHES